MLTFDQIGLTITIPVAFHSCVALLCSLLIFPQTVRHQFRQKICDVLVPLSKAIKQQRILLNRHPNAPEFLPQEAAKLVSSSEAALAPLAISAKVLKNDIILSRFGAGDFTLIHESVKRLVVSFLAFL